LAKIKHFPKQEIDALTNIVNQNEDRSCVRWAKIKHFPGSTLIAVKIPTVNRETSPFCMFRTPSSHPVAKAFRINRMHMSGRGSATTNNGL
jgi:hypothetical protein